MRTPTWHRRTLLAAFITVAALPASGAAVLASAAAAHARARARPIALALPPSAEVGARVAATGRVSGRARGRRVYIQALTGRRWRTLAGARVSRGHFKAVFTVSRTPGVMTVRAIMHRRRRRSLVSAARKLVIRARPQPAPLAPPAPPATDVAGWGDNSHHQLGGNFKSSHSATPVSVLGLSGVKSVAATYFTSYALLNDGTMQSWGGNAWGQLGNGTNSFTSTAAPGPVKGLTDVSQIAAAGGHAMALLDNGTVATWGGNFYGELGNGTTLNGHEGPGSDVPLIVQGLTGVVAIAAGGGEDAALLANGTVMAWGENKQGQLGDGTTLEKTVPTHVRGLAGVRAIALGGIPSLGGHLLALLSDGTVRAIGGNPSGQLGDGTTTNTSAPVLVKGLTRVAAVSAAVSHSMALLEDGTVMAWGENAFGELGQPRSGPERCGSTPTVACSKVPVPSGLAGASAISAGFRFSLGLSGGRVLAWGTNEEGQLGDGTTKNHSTPVQVVGLSQVLQIAAGEKHSLALLHEIAPPVPLIEVAPGRGSLTVSWKAGPTSNPWSISWRPLRHPPGKWGPYIGLPPQTRSYTISGLQARPYEVVVRNADFGLKIVSGTPLA